MKGLNELIMTIMVSVVLGETISGNSTSNLIGVSSQTVSDKELAKKFAPQLRFDRKAATFPQSPVWFWENSYTNENGNRIQNPPVAKTWPKDPTTMATMYHVETCDTGRVLIEFWFFYSYQNECSPGLGSHYGDWERVVVALNGAQTTVDRITYHQHAGHYTRNAGSFETQDGTHPVVYVGKKSHGSYHDDGGSGTCLYFEDYRNQGTIMKRYSVWNEGTMLPTYGEEDWQKFLGKWGKDGVKGPVTRDRDVCTRTRCEVEGCWVGKNQGSGSLGATAT